MAAQSSFKNMALCLTAICLVCSALLAFVNSLTEEPIAAAQQKKTLESLSAVLPPFDQVRDEAVSLEGQDYRCYIATRADSLSGCAVISPVIGFGGTLEVMVGFNADGLVWNTSVLSHSETPGLGAKCEEASFKDQFKQFDPAVKTLMVRKDGGDVDAITASTITSRAYTLAVANACKVFQNLKGGKANE